MGAWIEIVAVASPSHDSVSLPSWERGLKLHQIQFYDLHQSVAPLVGAWIEIESARLQRCRNIVAPLVGAWIEIIEKQSYMDAVVRRSPRGSVD